MGGDTSPGLFIPEDTSKVRAGFSSSAAKKREGNARKAGDPFVCYCCGKEYVARRGNFYATDSELFGGNNGFFPVCKHCVNQYFDWLATKILNGDKNLALRRVAQMMDWYVNDDLINEALMTYEQHPPGRRYDTPLSYYSQICARRYVKTRFGRTYIDTILERIKKHGQAGDVILDDFVYDLPSSVEDSNAETFTDTRKVKNGQASSAKAADPVTDKSANGDKPLKLSDIDPDTIKRFGKGFTVSQYLYLEEQYQDWTTRYTCESKTQEEIFKNLCLAQLNIVRATQTDGDIAKANKIFSDLVRLANIAPNQQRNLINDDETFGTLIQKWEEEEPIPEPDPKWADVDGIKKHISTWFFGHLCKMFNIQNDWAAMYDQELEKYTAHPPEYKDELDVSEMSDFSTSPPDAEEEDGEEDIGED